MYARKPASSLISPTTKKLHLWSEFLSLLAPQITHERIARVAPFYCIAAAVMFAAEARERRDERHFQSQHCVHFPVCLPAVQGNGSCFPSIPSRSVCSVANFSMVRRPHPLSFRWGSSFTSMRKTRRSRDALHLCASPSFIIFLIFLYVICLLLHLLPRGMTISLWELEQTLILESFYQKLNICTDC